MSETDQNDPLRRWADWNAEHETESMGYPDDVHDVCDGFDITEEVVRELILMRAHAKHLDSEIRRLADFICAEVPGEPSQNQGAVDTAIRWMRARLP